eukprot:gene6958-4924_t
MSTSLSTALSSEIKKKTFVTTTVSDTDPRHVLSPSNVAGVEEEEDPAGPPQLTQTATQRLPRPADTLTSAEEKVNASSPSGSNSVLGVASGSHEGHAQPAAQAAGGNDPRQRRPSSGNRKAGAALRTTSSFPSSSNVLVQQPSASSGGPEMPSTSSIPPHADAGQPPRGPRRPRTHRKQYVTTTITCVTTTKILLPRGGGAPAVLNCLVEQHEIPKEKEEEKESQLIVCAPDVHYAVERHSARSAPHTTTSSSFSSSADPRGKPSQGPPPPPLVLPLAGAAASGSATNRPPPSTPASMLGSVKGWDTHSSTNEARLPRHPPPPRGNDAPAAVVCDEEEQEQEQEQEEEEEAEAEALSNKPGSIEKKPRSAPHHRTHSSSCDATQGNEALSPVNRSTLSQAPSEVKEKEPSRSQRTPSASLPPLPKSASAAAASSATAASNSSKHKNNNTGSLPLSAPPPRATSCSSSHLHTHRSSARPSLKDLGLESYFAAGGSSSRSASRDPPAAGGTSAKEQQQQQQDGPQPRILRRGSAAIESCPAVGGSASGRYPLGIHIHEEQQQVRHGRILLTYGVCLIVRARSRTSATPANVNYELVVVVVVSVLCLPATLCSFSSSVTHSPRESSRLLVVCLEIKFVCCFVIIACLASFLTRVRASHRLLCMDTTSIKALLVGLVESHIQTYAARAAMCGGIRMLFLHDVMVKAPFGGGGLLRQGSGLEVVMLNLVLFGPPPMTNRRDYTTTPSLNIECTHTEKEENKKRLDVYVSVDTVVHSLSFVGLNVPLSFAADSYELCLCLCHSSLSLSLSPSSRFLFFYFFVFPFFLNFFGPRRRPLVDSLTNPPTHTSFILNNGHICIPVVPANRPPPHMSANRSPCPSVTAALSPRGPDAFTPHVPAEAVARNSGYSADLNSHTSLSKVIARDRDDEWTGGSPPGESMKLLSPELPNGDDPAEMETAIPAPSGTTSSSSSSTRTSSSNTSTSSSTSTSTRTHSSSTSTSTTTAPPSVDRFDPTDDAHSIEITYNTMNASGAGGSTAEGGRGNGRSSRQMLSSTPGSDLTGATNPSASQFGGAYGGAYSGTSASGSSLPGCGGESPTLDGESNGESDGGIAIPEASSLDNSNRPHPQPPRSPAGSLCSSRGGTMTTSGSKQWWYSEQQRQQYREATEGGGRTPSRPPYYAYGDASGQPTAPARRDDLDDHNEESLTRAYCAESGGAGAGAGAGGGMKSSGEGDSRGGSAEPRAKDAAVDTSNLPPVGERDLGKLSPLNLTKEARAMRGELTESDEASGGDMWRRGPAKVCRTPMENLTKKTGPTRRMMSLQSTQSRSSTVKGGGKAADARKQRRGFTIGCGSMGLEERNNPGGVPNEPMSLNAWTAKNFREMQEDRLAAREEAYRKWRDDALAMSSYAKFNEQLKVDGMLASVTQEDLLKFEEIRTKAIAKERRKRERMEAKKRKMHEEDLLKQHQKWKEGQGMYLPPAYYNTAYRTLSSANPPVPGAPSRPEGITVKDHHKAQQIQQQRLHIQREDMAEERRDEGSRLRLQLSEEVAVSRADTAAFIKAMKEDPRQRRHHHHRHHHRRHTGDTGYDSGSSSQTSSSDTASIRSWKRGGTTAAAGDEYLQRLRLSVQPQQQQRESKSCHGGEPYLPALPPHKPSSDTRPPSSHESGHQEVDPAHINSLHRSDSPPPPPQETGRRPRSRPTSSGAHINTASTHLINEMKMWETTFQTPNKRPPSGADPKHRHAWLQQLKEERLGMNQKAAAFQRQESIKAAESREAWFEGNIKRGESEREEQAQHLNFKANEEEKNRKIIEEKHRAYRHQQDVIDAVRREQEEARHQNASARREREVELAKMKAGYEAVDLEIRQSSAHRIRQQSMKS